MKAENTFSGNLFGEKSQPAEVSNTQPVTITAYSQPHVLQQRMKEEKLSHGETVMANLSPVRLEKTRERTILYFCPMKSIEVMNTISSGDGNCLPAEAKLEGLMVPDGYKGGYYTLKNVILSSNGTLQVRATAETTWEEVVYERF